MKTKKGLLLLASEKYPNDTMYFNFEKHEVDNKRSVVFRDSATKKISSFIEDDVLGFKVSFIVPGKGVHTKYLSYAEAQELAALLQLIDDSKQTIEIMEEGSYDS
jgi:hypothetical protein